ncbi:glial cell line-derived neurotrophic factor [Ictalurus punctatus]|uniref:Glial cell line-derived neurotrophic factor n=1 Tax=Ictalurus punctatus TaxID=7998 RepID=A0A2D0T6J4_ICTPU|nr:glial cell line-derived neurotrophic factor [Ictalurus punctatus]
MKLWKKAIFAFTLLSAALFLLLFIIMIPAGSIIPWASAVSVHPSTTAPSSPVSSSSSPKVTSHRRVARESEDMGSLLSEFSYLFQSFTEGELRRVIRSLVDRKVGRRTKRAKSAEACSLHQVVLTVSELGLGYESDETVRFRYCRGKCNRRLGNYDMVLKNVIMSKTSEKDITTKGGTAKTERAPYIRCCRPTKYENMSFFDNKAKFFTIQDVSARKCGCV